MHAYESYASVIGIRNLQNIIHIAKIPGASRAFAGTQVFSCQQDDHLHACGRRVEGARGDGVPHVSPVTGCFLLRYCHHIVVARPAMAGQQGCPKLASVPIVLCLCRLVPETTEKRSNIPPGMPEETTDSPVSRSFRSGRCPSCDFSVSADTARIRVSTPMMMVKAARFFRCGAIAVFLVHDSEQIHSGVFLYEPWSTVNCCCIPPKKRRLPDSPSVPSLAGPDFPVCILPQPLSRGRTPGRRGWIRGCDGQRDRSPLLTSGSEIPLGGEIAARAGQAHGMRHADVQTVAFERCPVDPGQFDEPVGGGAFNPDLSFSERVRGDRA